MLCLKNTFKIIDSIYKKKVTIVQKSWSYLIICVEFPFCHNDVYSKMWLSRTLVAVLTHLISFPMTLQHTLNTDIYCYLKNRNKINSFYTLIAQNTVLIDLLLESSNNN